MSVTITEGYLFVTSASVSNDTINVDEGSSLCKIIGNKKVTHDYNNDLFFTPIPNLDSTPDPRVLNLAKTKEAVTVQGILKTNDISGSVGSRTAIQKKEDLITLAKGKQPVTLVWGVYANSNQQKHIDFNINKIQFDEVAGIVEEGTTRSQIDVTLTGLLGSALTS